MELAAKELPPVLRALAADVGARQRKYLVLAVKRGAGVNGASIEATLGALPVTQVSYQDGGGYRTQSPVFLAHEFGGKYWFGVDPGVVAVHTFKEASQVGIATDHWLEQIEALGGIELRAPPPALVENDDFGGFQTRASYVVYSPGAPDGSTYQRGPFTTLAEAKRWVVEDQHAPQKWERADRQGVMTYWSSDGYRIEGRAKDEEQPLSGFAGEGYTSTPADAVRIRVEAVEDDGSREMVGEWSLEEMLADNLDDEELCERMIDLRVGQTIDVGGGAAPHMRLTRLSNPREYVG